MKSKQKWLFHGCSMTQDYFEPMFRWEDLPWDPEKHENRSYPYWLSQTRDIDFVNLAYGGNGNDLILTESIDYITHHDDIDGVCVGLSGWERFEFFGKRRNVNTTHHILVKKFFDEGKITRQQFRDAHKGPSADIEFKRFMNEVDKLGRIDHHPDVIFAACDSMANDDGHAIRFWTLTLKRLITLQRVCDMKNIPLVVAQNIPPVYYHDSLSSVLKRCPDLTDEDRRFCKNMLQDNEYVKLIIKTSKYYKKVEEIAERGNVWGWPFFPEWGGTIVSRAPFLHFNGKIHISETNRHWNKKGHQLVAKHVYGPMIEKHL